MKRFGVLLILILAFCGLSDSAYIAQNEAHHVPLLCNVTNLSDCNIVATSPYSRLFGVSVAGYGIIFYGIIFILAALELVLFNRFLRRALQGISLIGVLVSLYFTSIEIFVIHSLCIFCVASTIIVLLAFIFAMFIEPIRWNMKHKPPLQSAASPLPPPAHLPMPPTQ